MIQNENYSDNENERTILEKMQTNNLKNDIQKEIMDNENYKSVIEINKEDFSSDWRTTYSDEI